MSKAIKPLRNLTPLESYHQDIATKGIIPDKAQEHSIGLFDNLYSALIKQHKYTGYLKRRLIFSPAKPINGLYLCGSIGRGKTYMMDLFCHSLSCHIPTMRIHFHRFMQQIHQDLHQLKGQKHPLHKLATNIAKRYKIICLDELFVSDIGDAMILGNLLTQLFKRGVTLVITSNTRPQDLYKDGLQRALFLPAIEQLVQHTQLIDISSKTDYRLRTLEQDSLWYSPLNEQADQALQQDFSRLTTETAIANTTITIYERDITARYLTDNLIWFNFSQLCDGPRSKNDYIELAKIYPTVFISNIPLLDSQKDTQALRFIYLIDEFYDRSIKLFISAAAPAKDLYSGTLLKFEFARAESRLHEMQSDDYLARSHKP